MKKESERKSRWLSSVSRLSLGDEWESVKLFSIKRWNSFADGFVEKLWKAN